MAGSWYKKLWINILCLYFYIKWIDVLFSFYFPVKEVNHTMQKIIIIDLIKLSISLWKKGVLKEKSVVGKKLQPHVKWQCDSCTFYIVHFNQLALCNRQKSIFKNLFFFFWSNKVPLTLQYLFYNNLTIFLYYKIFYFSLPKRV